VRGRFGSVLHPEAQTVDEMLEGWRNQQLCGDLDHGTIVGALLDVLAAIKRCHDRPAPNSLPM
jgi:integrase/recombinase XerD